jgi:hypothetical protein
MGGDGKPSRQQSRPLRSRVLPPLQHCYSPQAFVPGGEAMRMMPAATDRDEALPAHSSQSSIKRGQWLLRALAGSRRRGRRQMPTHKFVGSRQILQCVGQIKIGPSAQALYQTPNFRRHGNPNGITPVLPSSPTSKSQSSGASWIGSHRRARHDILESLKGACN